MRLDLRYFAWVRERLGTGEETVDLPETVTDGAGLLAWLAARDEANEAAFGEPRALRIAYDKRQVELDAPLSGVREVAVYPPMTGG